LTPDGVVGGVVGVEPPGRVQFWLAVAEHVQIWSRVPLALLLPVTSRHFPLPELTRVLPETVHFWAAVLLQSYSWILAPLVVAAAVTSRHLPSARMLLSVLPTVHCWAPVLLQS
jgi:hypothetical protein